MNKKLIYILSVCFIAGVFFTQETSAKSKSFGKSRAYGSQKEKRPMFQDDFDLPQKTKDAPAKTKATKKREPLKLPSQFSSQERELANFIRKIEDVSTILFTAFYPKSEEEKKELSKKSPDEIRDLVKKTLEEKRKKLEARQKTAEAKRKQAGSGRSWGSDKGYSPYRYSSPSRDYSSWGSPSRYSSFGDFGSSGSGSSGSGSSSVGSSGLSSSGPSGTSSSSGPSSAKTYGAPGSDGGKDTTRKISAAEPTKYYGSGTSDIQYTAGITSYMKDIHKLLDPLPKEKTPEEHAKLIELGSINSGILTILNKHLSSCNYDFDHMGDETHKHNFFETTMKSLQGYTTLKAFTPLLPLIMPHVATTLKTPLIEAIVTYLKKEELFGKDIQTDLTSRLNEAEKELIEQLKIKGPLPSIAPDTDVEQLQRIARENEDPTADTNKEKIHLMSKIHWLYRIFQPSAVTEEGKILRRIANLPQAVPALKLPEAAKKPTEPA